MGNNFWMDPASQQQQVPAPPAAWGGPGTGNRYGAMRARRQWEDQYGDLWRQMQNQPPQTAGNFPAPVINAPYAPGTQNPFAISNQGGVQPADVRYGTVPMNPTPGPGNPFGGGIIGGGRNGVNPDLFNAGMGQGLGQNDALRRYLMMLMQSRMRNPMMMNTFRGY
jgi:hypothetical protein